MNKMSLTHSIPAGEPSDLSVARTSNSYAIIAKS